MKESFSLCMRVAGLAALVVAAGLAREAAAEAFLDIGVNGTHVEADIATLPEKVTSDPSGLHVGGGFRRELTQGQHRRADRARRSRRRLAAHGARASTIDGTCRERLALTAFAGAARLDLETPAYGYYLGGGVQLKELWPRWSLGLDLAIRRQARARQRAADRSARRQTDNFYDLSGVVDLLEPRGSERQAGAAFPRRKRARRTRRPMPRRPRQAVRAGPHRRATRRARSAMTLGSGPSSSQGA